MVSPKFGIGCGRSYYYVSTICRWRELHIAAGYSSSGDYTDEDVMTAAGMLEGYLSQP